MKDLGQIWHREPILVANAVKAILLLAVGFGLEVSGAQIDLILAALAALIMLFAAKERDKVMPTEVIRDAGLTPEAVKERAADPTIRARKRGKTMNIPGLPSIPGLDPAVIAPIWKGLGLDVKAKAEGQKRVRELFEPHVARIAARMEKEKKTPAQAGFQKAVKFTLWRLFAELLDPLVPDNLPEGMLGDKLRDHYLKDVTALVAENQDSLTSAEETVRQTIQALAEVMF